MMEEPFLLHISYRRFFRKCRQLGQPFLLPVEQGSWQKMSESDKQSAGNQTKR
jgi:hypothetical protein